MTRGDYRRVRGASGEWSGDIINGYGCALEGYEKLPGTEGT